MTQEDETPQRRRIRLWQEENPRDQMGIVALSAWLNVTPEKLPSGLRLHTCQQTKDAWARVEIAVREAVKSELLEAVSFAEIDDAVAKVEAKSTGVSWLDGPLHISKAVRYVLEGRLK